MCLSIAYKEVPGGENEKILEYVSGVKVDGANIILTDIMGAETSVPGKIKSMDFVNSKIIIEA